MDDHQIIQAVLSGDREAYAGLVRTYQARVLCLCRSMLSDPAQAEDAAQEIFLKAYRSLAQFRGRSAFSTWLYRIASRHCLDLLRRRARGPLLSWDDLLERHGEAVESLVSGRAEGGDPLEAADLARRLIATLPPDQRAALVLRESQGLTYQEIAEAMDCSLDSAKARLRRARENLRHFSDPADV